MDKTTIQIQRLLNEGVGGFGCLMVRLPVADSVEIQKWVDENIPSDVIITPERELHVTLLYGIKPEVPLSEVQAFVEKQPYVVFRTTSIGLFKQDNQDVVKITVDSAQLAEINRSLKEYLGEANVEPSKYDYNPHITLAYVLPGSCDHLDGNGRFDGYVYLIKEATYSEPGSKEKHTFKFSND